MKTKQARVIRHQTARVTSAALPVGTICTIYGDGQRFTVSRPYGAYEVGEGKGFGILKSGYVLRDKTGEESFYPAGLVVAVDAEHNYSHLRLVKP